MCLIFDETIKLLRATPKSAKCGCRCDASGCLAIPVRPVRSFSQMSGHEIEREAVGRVPKPGRGSQRKAYLLPAHVESADVWNSSPDDESGWSNDQRQSALTSGVLDSSPGRRPRRGSSHRLVVVFTAASAARCFRAEVVPEKCLKTPFGHSHFLCRRRRRRRVFLCGKRPPESIHIRTWSILEVI